MVAKRVSEEIFSFVIGLYASLTGVAVGVMVGVGVKVAVCVGNGVEVGLGVIVEVAVFGIVAVGSTVLEKDWQETRSANETNRQTMI